MKQSKKMKRYTLGELIVALFEQAKKVSPREPQEQKLLVYLALHDLLRRANPGLKKSLVFG